jgi:hypothetical protein
MRTYFAIVSDKSINFDEFQAIDLKPTKSWQLGDKLRYNPNATYSRWEFSTDEVITLDYQEVISKLLDMVIPYKEALKEIVRKNNYDCYVEAVIYINIEKGISLPSIHLDKKAIDFLSYLGAEFDVDLYDYNSSNSA